MSIIVQKYGGTSVSSERGRQIIAQNAIKLMQANKKVVIVVSAMGRKGEPYATDTLMALYNDIYTEKTSEDLDLLLSCGETISAALIANTIRKYGLKAKALMGFQAGITTNNQYGNANVKHVDTSRISALIDEGYVTIVTGFQGISEDNNITTLGRGGSDTTAALLGEALDAEQIEIYTDVDGVMTADPRLCDQAKVLPEISFEELHQMALDGAKVVHPRAVAVARRANKPLLVKNTFSESYGTKIVSEWEAKNNKLVTAVTSKSDILQVKLNLSNADDRFGDILKLMEASGISIDMINFLENEKIFTIESTHEVQLQGLLKEVGLTASLQNKCAKVTIVGHGIHGVPGVMKTMVLSLTKAGVNILQTSDSHTTISCLIKETDLIDAIKALHDTFELS